MTAGIGKAMIEISNKGKISNKTDGSEKERHSGGNREAGKNMISGSLCPTGLITIESSEKARHHLSSTPTIGNLNETLIT